MEKLRPDFWHPCREFLCVLFTSVHFFMGALLASETCWLEKSTGLQRWQVTRSVWKWQIKRWSDEAVLTEVIRQSPGGARTDRSRFASPDKSHQLLPVAFEHECDFLPPLIEQNLQPLHVEGLTGQNMSTRIIGHSAIELRYQSHEQRPRGRRVPLFRPSFRQSAEKKRALCSSLFCSFAWRLNSPALTSDRMRKWRK